MRRLTARDGSTPAQAQAILNAQASRTARLKAADDVITNDSDMGSVRKQVQALHAQYLKLAAKLRL
jgi:dephospho-CoA kinase